MPASVNETALLTTTREVLSAVAKRMKKDRSARIAIIGFVWGEIEIGESSSPGEKEYFQTAVQRTVNAKAYLVKNHRIDPARIMLRVGKKYSSAAEIIYLPDSNGAESPWLQETFPVDESATKPIESDLIQPAEANEGEIDGQR